MLWALPSPPHRPEFPRERPPWLSRRDSVIRSYAAGDGELVTLPLQLLELPLLAVMAALRSNNGEVRVAAAELAAQLKEGVVWYRIRMANALARLGDRRGRETLISVCHRHSESGSVRMYAATILSTEFQDDSCLDLVFDVLQKDSDPKDTEAKEQALELTPDLIGRLSPPQSQKLFDLLTKALGDPWPGVRITASMTLDRLGDVAAIPRLQAAIANEKDEGCRSVMARELKWLQSKKGTH